MTVAGADVSTHTVARSPTTRRSNGPSRSVITHDLPSPGRAPQSGDSPAADGPCDDRVEAAGVGAAPVHTVARRARRELLVRPTVLCLPPATLLLLWTRYHSPHS